MARYLVLIYGNEQRWDTMTDAEREQIDEGHRRFTARARDAILAAGQLEATATATTVRSGLEGPAVTDGPFLETKEVLGGFYVIDVPDLDTALALVGELGEVTHDHSGVQVHPLVEQG